MFRPLVREVLGQLGGAYQTWGSVEPQRKAGRKQDQKGHQVSTAVPGPITASENYRCQFDDTEFRTWVIDTGFSEVSDPRDDEATAGSGRDNRGWEWEMGEREVWHQSTSGGLSED